MERDFEIVRTRVVVLNVVGVTVEWVCGIFEFIVFVFDLSRSLLGFDLCCQSVLN